MTELELVCRRLVQLFPDDPSAPSVTVAWLEEKQTFYVSLLRYTEAFGRGRTVVHNLQRPTLAEALAEAMQVLGAEVPS